MQGNLVDIRALPALLNCTLAVVHHMGMGAICDVRKTLLIVHFNVLCSNQSSWHHVAGRNEGASRAVRAVRAVRARGATVARLT